jgi:RNA polymerase sigma-70 factor (ECF subfamily)
MTLGYRVRVLEVDAGPDYATLFREIGPQLWRAILAYSGGRRDVADDAVGEAFARALASRTPIRSPFPWLYRTAFRIAAAELRREVRQVPQETAYLDDPSTGDLIRAMRQLSPKARAAIYLHYQAGLSIRELARATGSSIAAVKVQLHRGRNRLRELLGAEEPDS